MQKLFSSSSITNQPPTSRSIQPPGFAGKPSPSALPIASQTRPFRNETGGSEQLPPMLERDRFVPSSRFSLEPRYSSSTTLPTSRDSFYASGYHNGGTHPNPTKVFVSLELPKELMAATSSFSSPASETAPRRSLPLTGYNGVRDSFSLEANSMTPPAHARQQGRGGLPFLSDPPHVVQLHRAELERLNRREVDGEGRPVVSKAAGMRAGLLQEFLKGSPGSSRIGSLAGSKRGSFLNDSGSSEERTSTVSSGNGLGNLNSVSNLSDPDRTGSRVIETMLRNSKTMREEAERYVPSVLEGGDMRGSRGLPQSRCQIQLEKISNSRSSHVTLNDSSIQIGCESGSTSSSLPSIQAKVLQGSQSSLKQLQNSIRGSTSSLYKKNLPDSRTLSDSKSSRFQSQGRLGDSYQQPAEHEGDDNAADSDIESTASTPKIRESFGKSNALLPPEHAPTLKLVPCHVCGRTFALDRLSKHEKACKVSSKQRKVFDEAKMRTKGTDLENAARIRKDQEAERKLEEMRRSKKEAWKQKHEDLIGSLRAAKTLQAHLANGGKASDLPPPPPSKAAPAGQECPHCLRRFNENSYERHVEVCLKLKQKGRPNKLNPHAVKKR